MNSNDLPRSSPEAQGVDPAGISTFLDRLESASDIEMHSLMIIRHGAVVAEGWWSPYAEERVHLLYSLSKSFTSTAAAFAVAQGLLDLDATVLSYFPEFDSEITDPHSRSMLVGHVAAMASGHLEETVERAFALDPVEPVRGFLLIPPDREPGSVFAYNQPCTYALAAIIQRLTGQTLTACQSALQPRLLDEKVSGVILVDWAAWAASTTFSFTGSGSGYERREVDAFRSAVRDTFLGVSEPAVRSDDVRSKQFSSAHRLGYDRTEVEAFVEAAGLRPSDGVDGQADRTTGERCHSRRVGRVGRLNEIFNHPPSVGGLRDGGGGRLPERAS